MNLPPLPKAAVDEHNLQGGRLLYTLEQIQAYGRACARAALITAYKILEEHWTDDFERAKTEVGKLRDSL